MWFWILFHHLTVVRRAKLSFRSLSMTRSSISNFYNESQLLKFSSVWNFNSRNDNSISYNDILSLCPDYQNEQKWLIHLCSLGFSFWIYVITSVSCENAKVRTNLDWWHGQSHRQYADCTHYMLFHHPIWEATGQGEELTQCSPGLRQEKRMNGKLKEKRRGCSVASLCL